MADFFRKQSQVREQLAGYLIRSELGNPLANLFPDILCRQGPWNIFYLYQIMHHGNINALFVNSKPGKRLIESIDGFHESELFTIPDPVEPWFNSKEMKDTAREKLKLPNDELLFLFFGEIRHEKGVDILINALEKYDGPNIGCIIAGKPIDIDKENLQSVTNSSVKIHPRLEYIPQENIRLYYESADCVVFPYRPSFGKYRRSGTFQKACSAGRPVIASSFGQFKELISEWNLGTTFPPGSSVALAEALESVVSNNGEIFDQSEMQAYARNHTYKELAKITSSVYRKKQTTK